MSDENYAYQVSVKFGSHDQYMANIRAQTEGEFNARLNYLIQNAGTIVLAAETVGRTALEGQPVAAGVAAPAANPVGQAVPPAQPAAQQPANPQYQSSVPVCAHGPMTYRTGRGNDGQEWFGYFCPRPRTAPDRCKPVYPGR